ncbi:MAG: hypothetical protein LBU51_11090 [Bacteroidales bacterium]|jgi:hypothetical protein|nr:hypothetical protein [Bacteroidales bacterium]
MKRELLLLLFTILLVYTSVAQYEVSTTLNKISYTPSLEFSPFVGSSHWAAGDNTVTAGIAGTFTNSIAFKNKYLLGVGTGFEFTLFDDCFAIPLYANFKFFFNAKKQIKPFFNVSLGTRLECFSKYENVVLNKTSEWIETRIESKTICFPEAYFNISFGFKVKYFIFSAGYLFKTGQYTYYQLDNDYTYKEKFITSALEIKVGVMF